MLSTCNKATEHSRFNNTVKWRTKKSLDTWELCCKCILTKKLFDFNSNHGCILLSTMYSGWRYIYILDFIYTIDQWFWKGKGGSVCGEHPGMSSARVLSAGMKFRSSNKSAGIFFVLFIHSCVRFNHRGRLSSDSSKQDRCTKATKLQPLRIYVMMQFSAGQAQVEAFIWVSTSHLNIVAEPRHSWQQPHPAGQHAAAHCTNCSEGSTWKNLKKKPKASPRPPNSWWPRSQSDQACRIREGVRSLEAPSHTKNKVPTPQDPPPAVLGRWFQCQGWSVYNSIYLLIRCSYVLQLLLVATGWQGQLSQRIQAWFSCKSVSLQLTLK